MAERRKNKKKKEADVKLDDKPSKEEYAVAKYLKQTLPEKKTTLLGHKVEYFIGSKAVDCLAESQWAKDNKKGELNFSNRDVAVDFMARLLEHKFFHRAKKIVVQKDPKKKKKKEGDEAAQDSSVEKETKKSSKKTKTESTEKVEEKDSSKKKTKSESAEKVEEKDSSKEKEEKKDEKTVVEKKKEKKKIKLDMHLDQFFIDSNEPYVWIYDPIPLRTWITGTLMVVAAVLLCLFPLWPQTIRHYIYYLSVAAACFLVFIIGLAVLRLVVFVLVWIFTLGKHHLWLLPNLTEDVGFFESFWPLYHYEFKPGKTKEKKPKEDTKEGEEGGAASSNKDGEEDGDANAKEESQGEDEEQHPQEEEEGQSQSESEEGDAHKTDNGFEFLEAEETEEQEDRKTK